MNVLEKVAQPHREVVYRVLQERAPELLARLLGKESPSYAEVEQVEDVMYDVVTEHFGPDQAPNAEGLKVEDALVFFVGTFPSEDLSDSPLNSPVNGKPSE